MKKPIITAVNGTAAGAGMGLAILGDLVIASESAKFTLAYTNVGLTPDGSVSYFLPRIVGAKRALELTLTNRVLSASEAQEWGLVTQVVANDHLIEEVEKLAMRLSAGPINAYGEAKVLMNSSFDATLETQLAKESSLISKRIDSPEGQEGVIAFLEKREANYNNLKE